MSGYFTSESVTEGHPDKLCDQISDAILDSYLAEDSRSRVACETTATTGLVLVAGEVTSRARVDIQAVVRATIARVGYNNPSSGFDATTCAVLVALGRQSPDIAMGVDLAVEARSGAIPHSDPLAVGAGDQGMMFGYACDETAELIPLPIWLAHALCKRLADVRRSGTLPYLRPDGKSQVTIEYVDGRPARLEAVVVSAQHDPDVDPKRLQSDVLDHVVRDVVPDGLMDDGTKKFVNPTGRFVVGGPPADTGLTGRKIIVDSYGGFTRHGGGAFSGKDPTKVDRSGAYAARWVAKNVVAASLARRCEVSVCYAIGVSKPMAITIDTFGTGTVTDEDLLFAVNQTFDLRPGAIISELDLQRPIYSQTAAYGHFGRSDITLPWEATNRVELLRDALESGRLAHRG